MNYKDKRIAISKAASILRASDEEDPTNEALADVLEVVGDCIVDIAKSLHDLADTQAGR